jgi:hypothetical protein
MTRIRHRLWHAILVATAIGSCPAFADDDSSGTSAAASGPTSALEKQAPASSGGPAATGSDRVLPFMADEAIKRGIQLPLPFGVGLVLTGLDGRKIDVSDVRVGVQNPPRSVSDFLSLGATSNVFNANLKFDAWLLPFLDVYALVGYVRNQSSTHALITVPRPGPMPGTLQFAKDVKTDLEGMVGGGGVAIATGYRNFFFVLDAAYIQSNLGFDNAFKATIATMRAGYRGRIGALPLQLWLGVGDWDTAAIAKGHVDLGSAGQLNFEVEQKPHTPWMYDLGANLEINKSLQLVVDIGTDFDGGYLIVAGPTYRF